MIRRLVIISAIALSYLMLALAIIIIPGIPELDEAAERLAAALHTYGEAVGRLGDRSHRFG